MGLWREQASHSIKQPSHQLEEQSLGQRRVGEVADEPRNLTAHGAQEARRVAVGEAGVGWGVTVKKGVTVG